MKIHGVFFLLVWKIGFYRFDKISTSSGATTAKSPVVSHDVFWVCLWESERGVQRVLVVFWAWEQRKWAFIFRKIVDNYHDVVALVPYTSCHHHQKVQKRGNRIARAGATFLKGNARGDALCRSLTGKWRQFPWKNRQVETNLDNWNLYLTTCLSEHEMLDVCQKSLLLTHVWQYFSLISWNRIPKLSVDVGKASCYSRHIIHIFLAYEKQSLSKALVAST